MKRFFVVFSVLFVVCTVSISVKWSHSFKVSAQSENAKYFLPILGRPTVIPQPSVFLDALVQDFGRRTGAIKTGFSIAVPYLDPQETFGADRDYEYNPEYLNKYIEASKQYQLPMLVHLNAHRATEWSDARLFPESIFAKITKEDPYVMMYTQDGVSLLDTPEWKDSANDYAKRVNGVMWSLNVYNDAYRQYKKRNVQAVATRLNTFSQNNPGLFVGVSLDSEISLCSALSFYAYDWNPETIVQYRYWLSGNTGSYLNQAYPNPYGPNGMYEGKGLNLTLDQIANRHGVAYSSWDMVFPPKTNGDIYPNDPLLQKAWEDWQTFKASLVNNMIADLTQWLVEAGLPKDKIYSHQPIPDKERPDTTTFCGNTIQSAYVSGVGLGFSVYQDRVLDDQLFSDIQKTSGRWGIFQWNPRKAYASGQVSQALNMVFNQYGASVITPQFYYPVQTGDIDNIWENQAVMDGIRQFLNAHSPIEPVFDLNADGVVNLFDYNIFVAAYMNNETAKADLNTDGRISIEDINLLLGHMY